MQLERGYFPADPAYQPPAGGVAPGLYPFDKLIQAQHAEDGLPEQFDAIISLRTHKIPSMI